MNADDAKKIAEAGCKIVAEGANMPSDPEAIKIYHEKDIEFGPAKVLLAGLLLGFKIPCSTSTWQLQQRYRRYPMFSMSAEAAEHTDWQRCRCIAGHII